MAGSLLYGRRLATPALGALVRNEAIDKTMKFIDHAPTAIDCDFTP